MSLGLSEIVLILIVVLILFGGKRIPELAKDLGKSFSSVNAYCSNRTQPSLDVLKQIADILSVNMKDLIVD